MAKKVKWKNNENSQPKQAAAVVILYQMNINWRHVCIKKHKLKSKENHNVNIYNYSVLLQPQSQQVVVIIEAFPQTQDKKEISGCVILSLTRQNGRIPE